MCTADMIDKDHLNQPAHPNTTDKDPNTRVSIENLLDHLPLTGTEAQVEHKVSIIKKLIHVHHVFNVVYREAITLRKTTEFSQLHKKNHLRLLHTVLDRLKARSSSAENADSEWIKTLLLMRHHIDGTHEL